MSWNLSGSYFESCNCDSACPCVFLSPPTTGECTAIVGWHINEGSFEALRLDGLNVALAVHSPGHMAQTPWRVALYLDDQGSEEQQGALGSIFSGSAGGHPAVLAGHIGEVLGVASAPIAFEDQDGSRTMRVAEVADVKIMALAGQGGAQVTIANHPLAVAPGQELVAARSDHLRFTDHGYEWELSQRNGFFSPFAYSG
ncbi:MAG: DUF1326 domain-containing protein [Nocardioides sp.]|nr:DUF1326 domain-containing protein [Nocardioides sp.]